MAQGQQHLPVRKDDQTTDHGITSELPALSEPVPAPPTDSSLQTVTRDQLINKLNYVNFQNRTIQLGFEHTKYGHFLRLDVRPEPCRNNQVRCVWVDPLAARDVPSSYIYSSFFVPDEQMLLRGSGRVTTIDDEGIEIELPETCAEVNYRKVGRHSCEGIHVHLLKNGSRFEGTLLDFSPLSFRARVHSSPPQTFRWLVAGAPVTVILSNDREILFSGDCKVLHMTSGRLTRDYVLEPAQEGIERFERKEHRSVRQEFVPAPTVAFHHPLTGRLISLKVLDLSTSGVAVEEFANSAVLMPGLMIPHLDLCLAGNLRFPCRAQVVHRQILDSESDDQRLKYGLALLDMQVADHVQLVALLHQADDRRSYVCNHIDMDELWNFFFETGFIYPRKYDFIHRNRDKIKLTYTKLYRENPSIARHFVYRDRSRILGHMAMVRFYDSTWLIHHHAARSRYSFKAGLNVLEQISRFVTESCRFSFMHMEYVICFYRPENRFPKRIFGGVCRSIGDPTKCSEVTFAYLHLESHPEPGRSSLGESAWSRADDHDLRELSRFCQHQSGGLMLGALNLEPGDSEDSNLEGEFASLGLKRERQLFALRAHGHLQAVAMVNVADIGLNLSELTNSITLFVIDQNELTKEILTNALSLLMMRREQRELPVLIYPEAAARNLKMPFEKRYVMWCLNPHHSDCYNRSLETLFRAARRNGGPNDNRRSPPL